MQLTILILATWIGGSAVVFGILGLANRDARLRQENSPRLPESRSALMKHASLRATRIWFITAQSLIKKTRRAPTGSD